MAHNAEEVESRDKVPRFEWYQTDGHVVVSFFVKGVKEGMSVRCDPHTLDFKAVDEAGERYSAQLHLAHSVKESCESKVLRTKVEIKLHKDEAIRWDQLERKRPEKDPASPGSNTKKWSELEKELKAAEADEKPEGDAALMKLFQDIYGNGSEEVKKAMMKSFYESNGTVLSTNWQEVGEKNVDVKAPDGMEYKKWSN